MYSEYIILILFLSSQTQGIQIEEIRPPPPTTHVVPCGTGRGKPLTGAFQKKVKLGVGRPRSLEKQGALVPTNNRRQRITELQRKRGPKPKMRGVFGAPGVGLQVQSTFLSLNELTLKLCII